MRHLLIKLLVVSLLTPPLVANGILYNEDFESGLNGFTIDNAFGSGDGLWHLSTACQSADPGHSATTTLAYADDGTCTFETGFTNQGIATSPVIDLSAYPSMTIQLGMKYFLETEGDLEIYDIATIEISENGDPFTLLATNNLYVGAPITLSDGAGAWLELTADLSAYAGSSIQLRFGFNTGDDLNNGHPGFYIDDITVSIPPLYQEDFESGLGGFTIDNAFGNGNGLWHLSTACQSADLGHSLVTTLAYAIDGTCTFNNAGLTSQGVATSPLIDLSGSTSAPITLELNYFLQTESTFSDYDIVTVEVSQNAGPFVPIAAKIGIGAPVTLVNSSGTWQQMIADLSAYRGSMIQVRFGFNTVDDKFNDFSGFYVDDVTVYNVPCQFTLPGDLNGDCSVNLVDFSIWSQHYLVDCFMDPLGPGCTPN